MAGPKKRGKTFPSARGLGGLPNSRVRSAAAPAHRIEVIEQHGVYGAFGYHSARVTAKDGRTSTPGSGDSHAMYDRLRLIDQAREFMRDNGIYKRMIDGATSYIVGTGFALQCKSGDSDWDRETELWWREEFWEKPEIRGILSGVGVEEAVCRELLGVGDHGIIKTLDGKLQLIESEQIIGPGLNDDGLVRNKVGRITGYWVAPYAKNGAPQVSKAVQVSAENFLFLTRPERPSMARSVPPCQSSFPMLHRIKDVCDSEAIAWQMLARVALVINRANASLLAQQTSVDDDAKSSDDTEGDFATRVHELDQALIFHGEIGEEIKGVDRNIPGKDFTASLVTFIRQVGLALGMPLEVLLLDWTKSNYSQSRAVIEQLLRAFAGWQTLLERFFHRPTYAWAVQRAMESGRLRKVEGWARHEWIKPSFPWIDQLKEAQAHSLKLDRGMCTHAQVLKSQGYDREEIVTALKQEVLGAIAIAKEIETETGIKVGYERFCGQAPAAPAPAFGAPGGPPSPGSDDERTEDKPETEEESE